MYTAGASALNFAGDYYSYKAKQNQAGTNNDYYSYETTSSDGIDV